MTDQPLPNGGNDDTPERHPSRLTYEIDDAERPSVAVVRAVAAFTDTPPVELEPLYDVIPPEHLDGSLQNTGDAPPDTNLLFTFNECVVTVTPTEVVVQRETDRT